MSRRNLRSYERTYGNCLNKSQRMQLKALVCVLGLLLLVILLIGRLALPSAPKEEQPEPIERVPVTELLTNVWIMETDGDGLLVFADGEKKQYPYAEGLMLPENVREQVADILLTDGKVTSIKPKTEKINGRVLRADSEGIELEGYGRLPLSENYRGYRIYNSLEMCTVSDLAFGYSFADFVIDAGEICGILQVKEEAMEAIRVLIKAGDYAGLLHEGLVLTSDSDFTIQYGSYDNLQTVSCKAGEEVTIDAKSAYFSGERILVKPDVLTGRIFLKNVKRSQELPGYKGQIELLNTGEQIAVINEVLLEEYLYSVVPSEMPASYPAAALQAQAICARTYAYGHMKRAGYPKYGAHVDDSTSYQVYNNIIEQESTTTAVKETYGQLLFTQEGELAGTYYYSTSCGVSTDAGIWKTEEAKTLDYLRSKEIQGTQGKADFGEALRDEEAFEAFIRSKDANDFEVSEGWYRWSYQVKKLDLEHLLAVLEKRYEANPKLVLTLKDGEFVSMPISELSEITGLSVVKRGAGGVADELLIETKEHTYKVISEHNIRYVLNDGESQVLRQDGKKIACPNILPSGFFVLTASSEKENVVGYTLTGGGFGHGVGMSQNGARAMAQSGYSARDILCFFYENCTLRNVYEGNVQ